jgi:hypothetical protein
MPEGSIHLGARFVGTPLGDLGYGLGVLGYGLGFYAKRAAEADSILADTAIRMNEYESLCADGAAWRRERRSILARANRDRARDSTYARLRYDPEDRDIESASALNVLCRELMSPRVHPTLLRLKAVRMPSGIVEGAPFSLARAGVVIAPRRLRAEGEWPALLQDRAFIGRRQAYEQAVCAALDQAAHGGISPAAADAVASAIAGMRSTLNVAAGSASPVELASARIFLAGLSRSARMLHQPAAKEALVAIMSRPSTSVAELTQLARLHHLQFAPAESTAERALYQELYPLLQRQLDQVVAQSSPPNRGGAPLLLAGGRHR